MTLNIKISVMLFISQLIIHIVLLSREIVLLLSTKWEIRDARGPSRCYNTEHFTMIFREKKNSVSTIRRQKFEDDTVAFGSDEATRCILVGASMQKRPKSVRSYDIDT